MKVLCRISWVLPQWDLIHFHGEKGYKIDIFMLQIKKLTKAPGFQQLVFLWSYEENY